MVVRRNAKWIIFMIIATFVGGFFGYQIGCGQLDNLEPQEKSRLEMTPTVGSISVQEVQTEIETPSWFIVKLIIEPASGLNELVERGYIDVSYQVMVDGSIMTHDAEEIPLLADTSNMVLDFSINKEIMVTLRIADSANERKLTDKDLSCINVSFHYSDIAGNSISTMVASYVF